MVSWRDFVDPTIKNYLERQITESFKYKEALNKSKNPGNTQLWLAVANLSKQLFEVNLKLSYLERALKDTLDNISKTKNVVNKKKETSKRKKTKRKSL